MSRDEVLDEAISLNCAQSLCCACADLQEPIDANDTFHTAMKAQTVQESMRDT